MSYKAIEATLEDFEKEFRNDQKISSQITFTKLPKFSKRGLQNEEVIVWPILKQATAMIIHEGT